MYSCSPDNGNDLMDSRRSDRQEAISARQEAKWGTNYAVVNKSPEMIRLGHSRDGNVRLHMELNQFHITV